MSDDAWEAMSGKELAHILALPEHAEAMQAALDAAKDDPADPDVQARRVLQTIGADPAFALTDVMTNQTSSRLEVLADELMRARLEEN